MKKEALRLSNSVNLSERLYDICKSGWMTKRSQNKKRFTPVNYKQRWFELTKYYLYYYDVENAEVSLNFNFFSHFELHFHFLCWFSVHFDLLILMSIFVLIFILISIYLIYVWLKTFIDRAPNRLRSLSSSLSPSFVSLFYSFRFDSVGFKFTYLWP